MGYSTHSVTETTLGAAIGLLRRASSTTTVTSRAARLRPPPRQFHFDRTTPALRLEMGHRRTGRHRPRGGAAGGGIRLRSELHSTSGVVREEPYPALPLTELLRWADIVSVHAPLNDLTRGVDRRRAAPPDETLGPARQRRPRRHRRRSGAGRSARRRLDRRRRARRILVGAGQGRQPAARPARPLPSARFAPQRMGPATGEAIDTERSCAASPATSKHT